ncbi:MAG: hypothetical protein GPJ13_05630 [Microcystis aeruginosa W11-06]|nr:hypothetical protein [Microcystis aeruginosa W11-03]NCR93263.1 hypothetical protein [Microcystis aeruginosa W11-06]
MLLVIKYSCQFPNHRGGLKNITNQDQLSCWSMAKRGIDPCMLVGIDNR